MNERRTNHGAVVCNGSLYAIGGQNGGCFALDTMERISVMDLVSSFTKTDKENKPWETLQCRLSARRYGCSTATVHNRYILVAGGRGWTDRMVSTVDVIDSGQASGDQPCSVFTGPSLNIDRTWFGIAVVGSCVYVVGGLGDGERYLNSVEYLEFKDHETNSNNATSVFPSSLSWTIHKELILKKPVYGHAVVHLRSCLVVSGGESMVSSGPSCRSVEVLDTKRNKVWVLPELTVKRYHHSMVPLCIGIVCIGGYPSCESSERISLMDKNSALFSRLLELSDVQLLSMCMKGKRKATFMD